MPDGLISFDTKSIEGAVHAIDETRRRLDRENRRALKQIAGEATGWVRGAASSGTPQERHFASALKARATPKLARIAVQSSGRMAGANVPFFGMERRTGWNARNGTSRPQGPKWVGSSWIAGRPGEGPYVFRDVIPARAAAIGQMIEEARMRAFKATFPKGG